MHHDGGLELWHGVGGNMPVELEVQRTNKRADICGLFMALSKLTGLAEI